MCSLPKSTSAGSSTAVSKRSPFNGKSDEFESWRELMIDMCATSWYGWRAIMEHLCTIGEPLNLATIRSTKLLFGLTGPQHEMLASLLWSHLGRCMDIKQRRGRRRVAGENLNGYELWRRLHWDHLDGGHCSSIRGSNYFRNFPRCERFEDLQAHIDE